MKRIIFVKDEDGLYDRDPKRHTDAQLIPRTTLRELSANMPEELILDRMLFDAWRSARHVERIQIINGLKPGMLTRAIAGEPWAPSSSRSRHEPADPGPPHHRLRAVRRAHHQPAAGPL
jgi:uridylate kinase